MFVSRLAIGIIAIICFSNNSFSQILPCIDVNAISRDGRAQQGVYDFNNKWTPGITLRVAFIGGTEWQREKVKQYAPGWSKYANVKFEFLEDGKSDIRVSFAKKGSYSYIGIDARNRSQTQETMNLGWIVDSRTEPQIKSIILHEFGHALGMLHEHMNPMSNIKWNKAVVYAYYLQYDGWDKETVDRQVFDRYSVTMTNKNYDPKSIMHYPIPENFTTDGYAVGENYELSESDKKLIKELYPFNKAYPPANKTSLWTNLEDLKVEYNVTENGKSGIRIRQDFTIYNAQDQKCIMAGYFYNADDGKPLSDKNGSFASADGKVAVFTTFNPGTGNKKYNDISLFIPFDELDLENGSFRIKCYVALFDQNLKVITSSGYQYFTYLKGMNVNEINATHKVNAESFTIIPTFTIENAKGKNCRAVVYVYDSKGVPLRDINNKYTTAEGTISSTAPFHPGYDITAYNNGVVDFPITLPMSELHLSGEHQLLYKVVLFDENWKRIASSKSYRFSVRL
jgi:hypothetical protein